MSKLNMKHLISIGKDEEGKDDDGYPIIGWQEHTKAWASIKTMKGYEYFAAAQSNVVGVKRFVIRYTPGIRSDHEIKYNGNRYKIESIVNDDEENKTITIITKTTDKGV